MFILFACIFFLFFLQDKDPFVSDRRNKLVKAGVVTALVALSKTESDSCRELLARWARV